MDIEMNVFENIFNTVMDIKRKTNDNIKGRIDLALYYNSENIDFVNNKFYVAKPKVAFTRGVHGSVRFGLDLKNQPNRITVIL